MVLHLLPPPTPELLLTRLENTCQIVQILWIALSPPVQNHPSMCFYFIYLFIFCSPALNKKISKVLTRSFMSMQYVGSRVGAGNESICCIRARRQYFSCNHRNLPGKLFSLTMVAGDDVGNTVRVGCQARFHFMRIFSDVEKAVSQRLLLVHNPVVQVTAHK